MSVLRMRETTPLRPFVASCIEFDMAGWPTGRHRGLPGATLTLVVSIGTPLTIRRAGHADLKAAATIAGLRTSPVDIIHDGTQHGVQLELTPRGARALLGLPAAVLAQNAWPLADVIGRRAHELADRLAGAQDPAARVKVIDDVLGGWAVDVRYPAAVDAFWRRLTDSAGCRSVATIASEIGLSRRHLGQLVRTELGLPPKVAARLVRFAEARRCLRCGQARSLAEATVMCGYFDQAHLTHEWNQFGGCTPGTWISEELPFLQDQGSAHGGH